MFGHLLLLGLFPLRHFLLGHKVGDVRKGDVAGRAVRIDGDAEDERVADVEGLAGQAQDLLAGEVGAGLGAVRGAQGSAAVGAEEVGLMFGHLLLQGFLVFRRLLGVHEI